VVTFPLADNGPMALLRIRPIDGSELFPNAYEEGAIRNYARAMDLVAISLSQAVIASKAALSIDFEYGNAVALSLGVTVTSFTLLNWPGTGLLGKLLLEVTSTGAFNIAAWPGTTIWNSGSAPTVTSGAGKRDTFMLTSSDGGINFRGYTIAQNMS
jgi:hypothetical protein